jgi:hypothetical protein
VNLLNLLKKPSIVLFIIVLIGCIVLSVLAYRTTIIGGRLQPTPIAQTTSKASPTPVAKSTATSTALQGLTVLPVQSPSSVLGVDANNPADAYPGVPWVRLGYTSCGSGNLQGTTLRNVIQQYHSQGIRVLLTYCQRGNNSGLYNTAPLNDIAHANADAVQCGNEEMKQDVASVSFLYIPPDRFARFYDMCERAVHAVRSNIPVLLGSLDPHVGGVDYQPLVDQANYLDQMQDAMNTTVHPGGNWDWHTQTLGLIDSWHNGYPDASVNSLYGLFQFWASQFQVDLNSGQLGQHLWVVEGTGCFTTGCGLDPNNAYQVAVSHTLTLVTDVQTAMRYKVPFFYFSGLDFHDQGMYWPIGLMTPDGKPKPIRQDLPMGARTLTMSCSGKNIVVQDQVQLLARLYAHCTLPSNYVSVISS